MYILDALMVRRHVLVLLDWQLAFADWAEVCPRQTGTLAFVSRDCNKNFAFKRIWIKCRMDNLLAVQQSEMKRVAQNRAVG